MRSVILLTLLATAPLAVGHAEAQDPTRTWEDGRRARQHGDVLDLFAEPRPRADVLSERATVFYTLGTIASLLSAAGVVLAAYVAATCGGDDCILSSATLAPGLAFSVLGTVLFILGVRNDRASAALRLAPATISLAFP